MKRYLKNKIHNLKLRWASTSQKRYIKFLREKGVKIGENIWITNYLNSISIDLTRPSLIDIGSNVMISRNFNIFTHDGSFYVLRNKYKEFIAASGRVKIGNNVYFARNCTVLKGVTIGDNCMIGFGSVVVSDIPSNSVAVGVPAKVVCSLEDYYKKRKKLSIEEAYVYARSIKERFNRDPVIEDFFEEFPLFLNGDEDHPNLPVRQKLRSSYEYYKNNHKAIFKGFDDFLKHAGL